MTRILYFVIASIAVCACRSNQPSEDKATDSVSYSEAFRPQFHFSPREKWMNDPNGMVYVNGEYHLFYQYYPDAMVWGPMHWGHAKSKDLVHWDHLPIALYPDSLGLIFSGSAVVDEKNSSGFGTAENPPLVAIFTYHHMDKEKAGRTDYQYQGIAYSTDAGTTWNKYDGNPVIPNQGIKDFRDPKVFYYQKTNEWIMALAVKDHIELWSSTDLKEWSKQSDFGIGYGAHGGVWECPDLIELPIAGEDQSKWVMVVSINPGGPNGGSATQYFIGDFDGKTFTPDSNKETTKWIDHGPDNYAGVTWSNAPDNRKIFLGWMNNWDYGQELPTHPWRGAMTLPRDIMLTRVDEELYVKSTLVPEFTSFASAPKTFGTIEIEKSHKLEGISDVNQAVLSGSVSAKSFRIIFSNKLDQKIIIGFDAAKNNYYIDRGKSGNTTFSKKFPLLASAPRIASSPEISFTVVTDVGSVEVFFDDGLSVMTSLYFPDENFTDIRIEGDQPIQVNNLTVKQVESIW